MKLYSTNDSTNIVDLKQATLKSLPKDKGLYLPCEIPELDKDFINNLKSYSFPEISYRVASKLIGEEIPDQDLERICYKAINFPAPVIKLTEGLFIQELFHGPSLAFKDFGARFMAELMSHFIKKEDNKLTILVATSGDTGGAVAAGFHKVDNIEVIIQYESYEYFVDTFSTVILNDSYDFNAAGINLFDSCPDAPSLISSKFNTPEINVYPNPASDFLNVESDYIMETIIISSGDGRIINTFSSISINNYSIDMCSAIEGMYFISVMIDNRWTTQKFIVHN